MACIACPMATSDPLMPPVTLAALSSTSTVHLRSAQSKTIDDASKARSTSSNGVDHDSDHEMHDLTEDDSVKALTEFTIFPKLPPEMQDEIWKYCVLLQPRVVELKSFLLPKKAEKNQAVILGQVNQHTRRQVYALHGYVELKHRKLNKTVVFNPKVDILYLAHKTIEDNKWNKERLMSCLERAGILDKVRCIALFCKKAAVTEWTHFLQHCTSLELLFLVVEQVYPLDPKTHSPLQPDFKFEDVELHEGSKERWVRELGSLEQYRNTVQGSLVRGSERVAPRVILVKEVWNLPTGSAFWAASMT